MIEGKQFGRKWAALAGSVSLLYAGLIPLQAVEKEGMPDLAQVEQTCLPTSTANLIIWFGHHGYPQLILGGETPDERNLHTVHRIMTDTDARFDWGTRMDTVTTGIEKYIRDAGYNCNVEYRGLWGSGEAFNRDWLVQNDDPNKGFILLLSYCRFDPASQAFRNALGAGHAVTLVNAEPDLLLIHDPAHEDDETGRKIITPYVLTSGSWTERGETASVAGLMMLSGSLLQAPEDSQVMVTGAVCVTMLPADKGSGASAAPDTVIAGHGSGATDSVSGGSKSVTKNSPTWSGWLFHLLFSN
jgi:hypothetical protein